jgi:hypothetical protein
LVAEGTNDIDRAIDARLCDPHRLRIIRLVPLDFLGANLIARLPGQT